jgi:hypothetical protein
MLLSHTGLVIPAQSSGHQVAGGAAMFSLV